MKKYNKRLCSCVICKKEFSTKGIYAHYTKTHTEWGKTKASNAGKLNTINIKKYNTNKRKNNIIKYNKQPKKCKYCNTVLSYDNRKCDYCNHSCAASYLNPIRTQKSHQLSSNDIRLQKRVCKVSFCTTCGVIIPHKRIKYCDSCRTIRMQELGKLAAIKNNFGGVTKSRRVKYKNVFLGSTYELQVAISLDKHDVVWEKPKKFDYIDPFDKKRKYEPDFFLPEYNVYLDPKNDFLINCINPSMGFKDSEKIRIVEQTHNIRILILNKDQLSWDKISKLVGRARFERA